MLRLSALSVQLKFDHKRWKIPPFSFTVYIFVYREREMLYSTLRSVLPARRPT